MLVYRIARKRFIHDLSGEGARIYGGRWNRKGSCVLYTAGNRALATVEALVHLAFPQVPLDTFIAEIEIPHEKIDEIDPSKLPSHWIDYPAPSKLAEMGDSWIKKAETLILKVPSAIVKDEWNYLVNPMHKDFHKVKVKSIETFPFSKRLLRMPS